jgi:hypothetical protein
MYGKNIKWRSEKSQNIEWAQVQWVLARNKKKHEHVVCLNGSELFSFRSELKIYFFLEFRICDLIN